MKRVYWEFINDTNKKSGEVIIDEGRSKKVHLEKNFKFILKRHKNSKLEEWIKIKNYYKEHENGEIETNISDVDNDIRKFERYGVALDGFAYASLALCIREHYLELEINQDNGNNTVLTEDVLENIVQMICEIIEDCYDCTEDGKDTYDIPIEEFSSIIQDSDYNIYKLSDIRELLREKKYIKCGQGRTSRQVRLNKGKNPVRVISFFKEKIDHLIPKVKKQKDELISFN